MTEGFSREEAFGPSREAEIFFKIFLRLFFPHRLPVGPGEQGEQPDQLLPVDRRLLSRSLSFEKPSVRAGRRRFFFFFFSPKTGGRVELFWPALTVCEPKAGLVSGLEPDRLYRGGFGKKL